MPTTSTTSSSASTRERLLDASRLALAQYGPRKLSLTDVATLAGVSRPTLYRHFASRHELLLAVAEYEKERFQSELAAVLDGLSGSARIDRALRFIAEFQHNYPMHGLVATDPGFMLNQLEHALQSMTPTLVALFEECLPSSTKEAADPADVADLIVRTALSHFLIKGDDAQLLRQLRHVAGRVA
jgi:AcrR family transcriptional regulator